MTTDEGDEVATTLSVGERLRAAREERKLTLEDVAEQTRIPRRHLEAIENGEWDKLPAPTYTVGFAKSYASAVGVDRNVIGDDVRDEIGTPRQAAMNTEVFEPVDPARTMPRWLVLGAIAAIVLVVLAMTWLNNRALQPDEEPAPAAAESAAAPAPATATPVTPPPADGPVVLTATEPVWIKVYEQDGRTLFQGQLGDSQSYTVPTTATAPMLRTGKAEALQVTVGGQQAPAIGPPAQVISDVSLLAPDVMRR